MTTPILLIAFNRPDTLMKVFECVRQAQPPVIYIAVDGPRTKNEKDRVKTNEVKRIVELIDWPCKLNTRFLEENYGCGKAPSSAISWAFETTDKLIVLEDDCVPSMSFFRFCDEMLERYEADKRVGMISGRSMQQNCKYFGKDDYIFSNVAHTWGWATWKRVWDEYDLYMKDYPEFVEKGGCKNIYYSKTRARMKDKHYTAVYNRIEEEVKHSWDSQWSYARSKNGYLGIVPRVNLIENIGGGNGTHVDVDDSNLDIKADELSFPLKHPTFIIPNRDYEILDFKNALKKKITLKKVWKYIKGKFIR